MTATDLTAAIWAAVVEHEGADPADWAALADLLTDQGDPLARPAAYLSRVAAMAAGGHRLAAALRSHLRVRAAGGLTGLATLLGVMLAHRAPHDTEGRGWAALARRIPFFGRYNAACGDRRHLRVEDAVRAAGGLPPAAFGEQERLRVEASALAEANGEVIR